MTVLCWDRSCSLCSFSFMLDAGSSRCQTTSAWLAFVVQVSAARALLRAVALFNNRGGHLAAASVLAQQRDLSC